MAEAAREQKTITRCSCVIVHTYEDGTTDQDSCPGLTEGPDIPFCADCERDHIGNKNLTVVPRIKR